MAHKKSKNPKSKSKAKVKKLDPLKRIDELDAVNGAAHRVNTVIQRMTAPPETVIDHLKRIGVDPVIDEFKIDDFPSKVYILIDYEELLDKELQNIKDGGSFRDVYPSGTKTPERNKNLTVPVILEEIKKRMQAKPTQTSSDQLRLSDVADEEEIEISAAEQIQKGNSGNE